jgi:hypothetical protein
MKHLLAAVVAVLVSACALSTLNKGLPYLVGKPIDAAVNVLGLPNQRMEVGPYNVYVWDNRFSSTIPLYNTSTSRTTGSVGTVPVYGTTTTSTVNYVPVQHQCQIKLQVDSNNIIQRWEYFGNQGGCQYYANGLKRIIPD